MLRASSHTRFARPAIFGDDFLRIELEETGEVVPILFSSISVVFSLALGFAVRLSLFHSLSFSLSVCPHLYPLVAAASLSVTLLCLSCDHISAPLFLFFSASFFIYLFLSFSLCLSLSLSIPLLRHLVESNAIAFG